MRRVLLTRPLIDAYPLAKILERKGIQYYLYPLFQPRFLPLLPIEDPQAVIITSKNALRAIEKYNKFKKLPLYAIGDETAQLARDMGFFHVVNASGTSKDLIKLILNTARPSEGIFWHLSGTIIHENIVEILQAHGFKAERRIVYYTEEVNTLPLSLQTHLKNHEISHVIFFSPHTVTLFVKVLKKYTLEKSACHMRALCLSKNVASKASELQWKEKWISSKPTAQSLMEYFDEKC
ncbi:MAG: uroporphyrinogen-III synthase [Alphaproteobacteria bacterium]|nr:uroporphyrinogen-III synthase [Alphaproteobacteria bacterium]